MKILDTFVPTCPWGCILVYENSEEEVEKDWDSNGRVTRQAGLVE